MLKKIWVVCALLLFSILRAESPETLSENKGDGYLETVLEAQRDKLKERDKNTEEEPKKEKTRKKKKKIKTNSEKSYVVVIPSYQNSQYYQKNLDSVFSQSYQNYRVIYIDDASPDNTGQLVKDYVKEKQQDHRFTLILNGKREGSLANLYKAIVSCKPQEIIVDLDGDDWLAHENVLQHLNAIYSDPNVWVTYGQFEHYPCGTPGFAAQVPEQVINFNLYRQYSWVTTALRTFYAGLFQKIDRNDLLHEGEFFQTAGDLAFMWPVVEMAGNHSRFIPDVLYIYNVTTPIRDAVIKRDLQIEMTDILRKKNKYQPIHTPF